MLYDYPKNYCKKKKKSPHKVRRAFKTQFLLVIKCCLLNEQAVFIKQQLQQRTQVTMELKS